MRQTQATALRGAGAPTHLRCENLTDPMGVDEPRPRLSWWVNDARRGACQTAYRVVVCTSMADVPRGLAGDVGGAGVAWDSGKVASERSVHVECGGPELQSATRYYWAVQSWDADGRPSPWSEPAFWEMGLVGQAQWHGQWLGLPTKDATVSQPCPYLRREFRLLAPVVRARAYATARGVFELHINGRRVGQDRLTPGWTDFDKRIAYMTYDVTEMLHEGDNAVGLIVGEGWYCGMRYGAKRRTRWGDAPSAMAQIVVEYEGCSREVIATDASFRAATGPLLMSEFYNGETYDARLEMPGWDRPGFDDSAWISPHVFEPPAAPLVVKRCQPVRAVQEIRPVEMTEPTPGAYVYHLGQNMVGWARLRIEAPAGTKITLRFAERLEPDGTLYTTNLRQARCTDEYICRGGGPEVYEPRFTFHGFQYAEISGCPTPPTLDSLTGIVVHTDMPATGRFECSSEPVNRLQSNIVWGQKGNFLEVPTDCPQRDERCGWTGDIQVFCRTAGFNMDVSAFLAKWMDDMDDAQRSDGAFPDSAPMAIGSYGKAAWGDAGIVVPWTLYQLYGDTAVLARHYRAMAAWVEFQRSTSDQLIRPDFGWGDWLATGGTTLHELIGTAFFALSCQLMAKIAAVLGKGSDADQYAALGRDVKAAFNRQFVTPAGRLVSDTQTGYALALAFDLLSEEYCPVAVKHLLRLLEKAKWHLTTGFVGTPLLCPVLSRFGQTEAAYKLLLQNTYPSWLYTVAQGATTMWERWDSWTDVKGFQTPSMNSFNHYAYGAVGEWMYAVVAGINVCDDGPGYRHVHIRPEPGGGITWAKGELVGPYGPIRSEWQIHDGRFVLNVNIPPNSHATVTLPLGSPDDATEGGVPIGKSPAMRNLRVTNGKTTFDVASGSYQFTCAAV